MKAIFIDAENHEVRDIEINFTEEGGFDEFYAKIGHGCNFVQATYFNKTEALIVDEEGHFRDIHFGFNVNGSHLMGNGIIVGNGDREFTDTNLTAEQVREQVTFFPEKTNFTPGPWKAGKNACMTTVLDGHEGKTIYLKGSSYHIAWANAENSNGDLDFETALANAALIAAAPDMYDMLQSVLDECAICDPNFHYPGDCDLRGQIEAVLKKARGEDHE
jgi:hypothetical protein